MGRIVFCSALFGCLSIASAEELTEPAPPTAAGSATLSEQSEAGDRVEALFDAASSLEWAGLKHKAGKARRLAETQLKKRKALLKQRRSESGGAPEENGPQHRNADGVQPIALEIRIVEVSAERLRQLGFDWSQVSRRNPAGRSRELFHRAARHADDANGIALAAVGNGSRFFDILNVLCGASLFAKLTGKTAHSAF